MSIAFLVWFSVHEPHHRRHWRGSLYVGIVKAFDNHGERGQPHVALQNGEYLFMLRALFLRGGFGFPAQLHRIFQREIDKLFLISLLWHRGSYTFYGDGYRHIGQDDLVVASRLIAHARNNNSEYFAVGFIELFLYAY